MLPAVELAALLRQFYAEVRKQNGDEYSRNALCGIRSAIHRHITSAPFHRQLNIMRGAEFKSANNVLVGMLKQLKRDGKDCSQSYVPISEGDLNRLMSSGVFGINTPAKLLKLVWFSTQFYFCRRGGEGLKDLRTDSFEIKVDSSGREYVQMKYNEASKNHPGGIKNTNDPKKKMYSTGGEMCPVAALKLYLEKVHPGSTVLYQRPVTKVDEDAATWYTGEPLGVNKLRGMMATLSTEAGLSHRYTNHCIRSTVITNLINSGFDAVTISRLSGHRNPSSVTSYCNDASEASKRSMADALTMSLQQNVQQRNDAQPQPQQISLAPSAPSLESRIARPSSSRPASAFLPESLFNNCSLSIGTINVYTK